MTKTNPNPLMDCTSPEYQELARSALIVCLRYEHASAVHEIDLEAEAYTAINALVEGKTLDEALGVVSEQHPFAYKLRDEIIKVAERLESSAGVIEVKITPLDATQIIFAVAVLGVGAFALCDRYQTVSEKLRIDLHDETYEALTVLVEGGPVYVAQDLLSTRHRGTPEVRDALEAAAEEVEAVRQLIARRAGMIRHFYQLQKEHPEMTMRPLAMALRNIYDEEQREQG